MKVSELEGATLDYWALRADGWEDDRLRDLQLKRGNEHCIAGRSPKHAVDGHHWRSPSTEWTVAGPIIEREGIGIVKFYEPIDGPVPSGQEWGALSRDDAFKGYGRTPLIAAMRAFVAAYFGEEVEDASVVVKEGG